MNENTFDEVVKFFFKFIVDNCKRNTVRELPNFITMCNIFGMHHPGFGNQSYQNQTLISRLSDDQLAECLRHGLEYVQKHLQHMQALEDGIPVTGGSIESWSFDNLKLDIISQDTRLRNVADYEIDLLNVNLAEKKFQVGVRWPLAHLTETYIMRGMVDNRRVFGAGRFRISVMNFIMSSYVHFEEEESIFRIKNILLTSDFEDARIHIVGLEVEGNVDAEQLMNNAIQRDKQKFREILHRNMEIMSKEVLVVLNLKLSQIHKNSVFNLITSWYRL